jgi:hypothetical protein
VGSLIPHAAAVRALVIAMIEAPFETPPMALARGVDRRAAGRRATRRRAVHVAPITRRADGEEAVAPPADLLAKRRVHDVGATARSDWTRRSNRGTRETTGSVRRSIEAVTEGLELRPPGLHLIRRTRSLCEGRGRAQIACGRAQKESRMRSRATVLAAFFLTVFQAPSTAQVPPELREAMRARLEAVWKKDAATWSRLTADEFTVVVPEGTLMTKADRLAALKTEKPQPVHAVEREQIRAYGETVVRRFVDENEWVLEVWVRQNGAWRVVAAQVNLAKQ